MRRILFLMILLIIILSISSQNQKLSGLVVIIDPGHGGLDKGAIVYLNRIPVIESVYAYDVALRLERMLINEGAIVFKTTKNDNIINNEDTIKYYPKTFFSIDGLLVEAGKLGLDKRTSFANLKFQKYLDKKIVFISIHFDISRPDYLGVRIIKGSSDTINNFVKNEFEQNYLLSNSSVPVLKNGDKTIGRKYVLGNMNLINNKILIELANLKNQKDLSRVVNSKVRENYALIITFALEKYVYVNK